MNSRNTSKKDYPKMKKSMTFKTSCEEHLLQKFLVPNIDQMYREMKKIVEVGNKHGNRDEFPDFDDLFFFLA
jgi:hypothetical protein